MSVLHMVVEAAGGDGGAKRVYGARRLAAGRAVVRAMHSEEVASQRMEAEASQEELGEGEV